MVNLVSMYVLVQCHLDFINTYNVVLERLREVDVVLNFLGYSIIHFANSYLSNIASSSSTLNVVNEAVILNHDR